MRGRSLDLALGLGLVFIAMSAPLVTRAANGIDVRRGDDATVFGSCVPSLLVENKSAETIDFLQVDLTVVLTDGQQRVVPLQSAYREGVLYPIAPGDKAVLKQPLDLSKALGVACGEVRSRAVARTICETGGKACASQVSVQP